MGRNVDRNDDGPAHANRPRVENVGFAQSRGSKCGVLHFLRPRSTFLIFAGRPTKVTLACRGSRVLGILFLNVLSSASIVKSPLLRES
jgi:hypothetical protein